MGRQDARIPTSIWRDEGFRQLSAGARLLYLMLLTLPELSPAGTLPLLRGRWATFSGVDPQEAVRAVDELAADGWLILDDDEQEAFVSRFFAYEKIGRQPRRVVSAIDAMRDLASDRIRACAAGELAELVSTAPAPVPRGVRAAVLLRDGYKCQSCGWVPGDPVPVNTTGRPIYRGLEIDHIWPRSKGGPSTEDNYQVLCTSCNSKKGAA